MPRTLVAALCVLSAIQAAPAACPTDVDGNGRTDMSDLLAVLAAWGTDDPAADIDGSGRVDSDDLDALVLAWGSCLPDDLCLLGEATALTPSDVRRRFGQAVDVDAQTAIVGMPAGAGRADYTGVAYVFALVGDEWTESGRLAAADGEYGHEFGNAVAISGDTAIVGAWMDDDGGYEAGAAYLFRRDADGAWAQVAKLTASDGAALDTFGIDVDISGDTAVIGANGDDEEDGHGAAYVFEADEEGRWLEVAKLTPADGAPGDVFGYSVAVDENVVIVGATFGDYTDFSGSAYVFRRGEDGAWIEADKLTSPPEYWGDAFGISVGVSGDLAIVGASWDSVVAPEGGAAYVFQETDLGGWDVVTRLEPEPGVPGGWFGNTVGIDGSMAIVGAPDVTGTTPGSVALFRAVGEGRWARCTKLDGGLPDELFGTAVSLNEGVAVIGAVGADDHAGAAYALRR